MREALPVDQADHLIDFAKELVQSSPDDESAWFMLAAVLKESLLCEERGIPLGDPEIDPRYSLCVEAFDRLVELNPDEPAYLWNRAMLKQDFGLPGEAARDLEAFLRIVEPAHAADEHDYRSWVGAAYDHLGCDYLAVGMIIEAYQALKKSIDFNPWYRYAWEDLSIVYEALGDAGKAAECLARAKTLKP